MTSALFGAIAAPVLSAGLSKVFSSKPKSTPFDLVGVTTPAFAFDAGRVKGGFNPSLIRRRTLFEGLDPEQQALFGRLRGLEEDVRPGFGRFTEAATRTIRNARDRGIGNLRAQLRQKRVSGASFAEDLITRTELEFAQEEERATSAAFLSELAVSLDIIDRENNLLASQLQADLAEFGIAANLSAEILEITKKVNAFEQATAAKIDIAQGKTFGLSGDSIAGALGGILFPEDAEEKEKQTINLEEGGAFRASIFGGSGINTGFLSSLLG